MSSINACMIKMHVIANYLKLHCNWIYYSLSFSIKFWFWFDDWDTERKLFLKYLCNVWDFHPGLWAFEEILQDMFDVLTKT